MTQGCKIWLWFDFGFNIIAAMMAVVTIMMSPLLGIYSMVSTLIMAGGIALLLFKQKKIGFYVILTVAAVGLVVNLVNGVNVLSAVFSAIASPVITGYFIHKNKEVFH